jgi:hypothetical protein
MAKRWDQNFLNEGGNLVSAYSLGEIGVQSKTRTIEARRKCLTTVARG